MELHYFPLRGRGEVLRISLAAAGAEYAELPIDYQEMKSDAGSAKYPFGQAPTFHAEGHVFAQMDAILRYIARKFNLYGSNNAESTFVDMILLAVESLRTPYADLIYIKRLSEEGKTEYFNKHVNKETLHERNGGAHFQFLENILQRNGSGFAVGSSLTVADVQIFDIVDLHLREALFPKELKESYPLLTAHHEKIASIPAIQAYLSSDKRHAKINGNELG